MAAKAHGFHERGGGTMKIYGGGGGNCNSCWKMLFLLWEIAWCVFQILWWFLYGLTHLLKITLFTAVFILQELEVVLEVVFVLLLMY